MSARRAGGARDDGGRGTDERPLSELLAEATSDLSVLVRKEMELAKIEMKEQVSRATKAGAMFGGTALVGFLALLLLSFAAAWGLAEVMATGLAFLVVGLVYALVAGLLFVRGRKQVAEVKPVPQQTVETLKEDVEWAKAMKQMK